MWENKDLYWSVWEYCVTRSSDTQSVKAQQKEVAGSIRIPYKKKSKDTVKRWWGAAGTEDNI